MLSANPQHFSGASVRLPCQPAATAIRSCRSASAHAAAEGMQMIPACAKIEAELAELDDADRQEMLEALGLEEPALNALVHSAYRLLGLESFYTAGPQEIRAEVYSVDELDEPGSEKAIREKGRLRVEGRGYVMHDADVVHFPFNVWSAGDAHASPLRRPL